MPSTPAVSAKATAPAPTGKGESRLANGSFSSVKGAMPEKWTRVPEKDADLKDAEIGLGPGRDSSPNSSLRAANRWADSKLYFGASQVVGELPEGREIILSGYVKGQDLADCALARLLFGYPASPEVAMGRAETLCARGTSDWKQFELRAVVPESLAHTTVFLGMRGTGQVWFDDLSLSVAGSASPPEAGIQNASIEEGQFGWQEALVSGPRATAIYHRDTEVAHSGNASLRIQVTKRDKPENFWNFLQVVDARSLAGRKVMISAWRTARDLDKDSVAGLLIVPVTKAGEQASLASQATGEKSGDWEKEKAEFDVPADCLFLWVRVGLTGTGTAWFDDVSLETVG